MVFVIYRLIKLSLLCVGLCIIFAHFKDLVLNCVYVCVFVCVCVCVCVCVWLSVYICTVCACSHKSIIGSTHN
jgi:hypothetical protein